eukprot:TRINITY_DN37403_c0_g1_i1.p1 TRINITY_DN37403_c0_g1~~TRINITY_DN37403_c0_g1_i1.p1  ORF type:complete len:515 (+),score=92.61 TRINITY_DN37403_c0_g1_i1:133-1677(+)
MPGFSSWAKERIDQRPVDGPAAGYAAASAAPDKEYFLLDNSQLKSKSNGMRYRHSPAPHDQNRTLKPVPWGKIVSGVLEEEGRWLRVREGRYLPVILDGVPVLLPCGKPRRGQEPEEEEDAPQADAWDRVGSLRVPTRFSPVSLEAAEKEVAAKGQGSWYEVVSERVALREGPSVGAPAITSLRRFAELELFGWDETRLWRQCYEPKLALSGWVLLDHPELGPLVRPKGVPLCVRPLNPVCTAAAEGRTQDLKLFLNVESPAAVLDASVDAEGRGPLWLAAAGGNLEACVRLVEAGADALGVLAEADVRKHPLDEMPLALLTALAGGPSDGKALNTAMESMDEECRAATELLLCRRQQAPTVVPGTLAAAMSGGTKPAPAQDQPAFSKVPDALRSPIERQPARADEPPARAEETPAHPASPPPKRGQLYEVVYTAVWVRRSPEPAGAQMTKRLKGDRIRIFDFDDSGEWGKVEVKIKGGTEEGWMLLEHEQLGVLLAPCEDDDDEGGLLKPEEL